MTQYASRVQVVSGRAEVQIGNASFTVSRRDVQNGEAGCPVEMIVGALGS